MTPLHRLLTTCLCACLLAACDVPLEGGEPPLEAQSFAAGSDGFHTQGTQLHGTPVRSVSYGGASVKHEGALRSATLKLVKGELGADMPLQVSGTTPSLTGCVGSHQGVTRSCGFTVEGQGVCTPGTTVQLTSGACGFEPGSCTGNPVARVCAGEKPCEYRGPGFLGHGDDASACHSYCPSVRFTCPDSGVYTVLSGAHTPGNFWSLSLVASSGRFPASTKVLRGRELVGAKLLMQPGATTGTVLEVVDAVNANSVLLPNSQEAWDSSGDTFLYRVRYGPSYATPTTELCATGAGTTGWAWAVPVKGIFDTEGNRFENSSIFTLGCDTGVIAKCYRWGYKPWMDGSATGQVTLAHHACTRMARADYCGNGTPHTQDGTLIQSWDALQPAVIAPPPADAGPPPGMTFEAGWHPNGPACLSHWRWKHLTSTCVKLKPPIYGNDGGILNDCRDPAKPYGSYSTTGSFCSPICDNPGEAEDYYGGKLFNNSASNGGDGGVGP